MTAALARWIGRLLLGSMLAIFALPAVALLGWQVRRMERSVYVTIMRRSGIGRRDVEKRFRASKDFTDMADPVPLLEAGKPVRAFWRHLALGFRATVAFGVLLVPIGCIFALAWWGGWNNSYYKGYENADYGAVSFLAALLFALPLLALHQMAQPHFAVQQRLSAVLEWRQLVAFLAAAPLRSLAHVLLVIVLSLPVFGFRALPVFAEEIAPQLAYATPDQLQVVRFAVIALTGAYVFLASGWIRANSARIYGVALSRMAGQPGLSDSRATRMADNLVPAKGRRKAWPGKARCALVLVVASVIWLALPVLVVVGQFMNINWMMWLNHPLLLLPWLPGG